MSWWKLSGTFITAARLSRGDEGVPSSIRANGVRGGASLCLDRTRKSGAALPIQVIVDRSRPPLEARVRDGDRMGLDD